MQKSLWFRLRRLGCWSLIGIYIGFTVFYQYRQIVGDTNQHPSAYFWTWDMFPNYGCFSSRRFAIGKTASGKYFSLFEKQPLRFRWGARQALSRMDFNLLASERTAQDIVLRTRELHAADPIVQVYIVQNYWPVRFNLPEPLYQELYAEPRPDRRYWRLLQDFAVSESGQFEAEATK